MPFPSARPQTVAFGRGSVCFLGSDAGRDKLPEFARTLETALRAAGVTERFASTDDSLFLRDWVHDGDTYLVMVSKKGAPGKDWGVAETEVAVRGDVDVTDVASGARIKSGCRDGYTTFRTLSVNGGRVFRLSRAPAPAGGSAATLKVLVSATAATAPSHTATAGAMRPGASSAAGK